MGNEYMEIAIGLALENVRSGRGGPFAAVVVKNAAIIATGTNLVTLTSDPTAHAEIVAIRRACHAIPSFQLTGCEIYTTCEPCPMCLGAIYWARPERVYYASTREDAAASGFDDSFIYEQLQLPHGIRKIPMLQTMREASLAALHEWDKKPDKVKY